VDVLLLPSSVLAGCRPFHLLTLLTAVPRLSRTIRVTLRLEVYRQSVHLGDKPLETPRPIILFSNWTLAVIVFMLHPLWREDGSAVYSCCWLLPAQSFLTPSPAGLMTTFYCLGFETHPTWRSRSPYLYPPGGQLYRQALDSLFVASTTRRATVEIFEPTSTRALSPLLVT
jgi:hypothetical protein